MARAMNRPAAVPVSTAWGIFTLEGTERGLCRLRFPGRATVRSRHSPPRQSSTRKILGQAKRLLTRYCLGHPVSFRNLKIDWRGYTAFERRILRSLSRIPRGRQVSYRHLALFSGCPRASRAVGSVMRKNRLPIIFPCHRVVRSDGALGRYSQGIVWKKRFLQLETPR